MAIDRDKLKSFQAAPARINLDTLAAAPSPEAPPSPTPAPEILADPADPAPAPAPAAQADPVAPDVPAAVPPVDDSPAPDARTRSQERIEDLAAQLKATREYADYQAKVIAGFTQPKPPEAPAPALTEDLPPTLEAHGFDQAKWAQAHKEWTERQVDARVKSALQNAQGEQAAKAVRDAYYGREAAFKATAPDFDVVVANPALPALSPAAAKAILSSEKGPQLVYHLAKNPGKAAHIARMSPDAQAMALGRLEAELSAPAAPRTTTKAPPPPSTTPAAAASGHPLDFSKPGNMAAFVEAERQAAAARRARRKQGLQ